VEPAAAIFTCREYGGRTFYRKIEKIYQTTRCPNSKKKHDISHHLRESDKPLIPQTSFTN
jgi:hypothetical protein